ncbi:MAG: sulfite exporter TauE/SafE family protein [Chromatiaceae bacterium]|nr:sulfite exporter TauE/SafE family protein [Candidatus Thioaporhodococcus sediminis]
MNQAYPLAFVIGLLSALHCIGMCGGIAGALSLSLPVTRRSQTRVLMSYLVAFNLGRVLSYALAGALFGSLGGFLLVSGHLWLHDALRWLAALVMVGAGLAIAGWLPRLEGLEKIGAPVWRLLEPWGRRLLPVDTLLKAGLYGAVWGWLPCGLVYTLLLGAPAQGGPLAGALYMALFGMGTWPVLIATGLFAGRLHRFAANARLRVLAGLAVTGLGLYTLSFQGYNASLL